MRASAVCRLGAIILAVWGLPASAAAQQSLTAAEVKTAEWTRRGTPSSALVLRAQVLLDRARASPGEIDGKMGENTRQALRAFRRMHGLRPGERLDEAVWRALTDGESRPVLVPYIITQEDVGGPFTQAIPADYREKAQLEQLGYAGPAELLAEKFHMSEDLLRRLNPGADFGRAGQEITVAAAARPEPTTASRVEVEARAQTVTVYGNNDEMIAVYPATVGSQDRPSPVGQFKVTAIAENPIYYYDPELNLRNVDAEEKLEIPAGPNNPVGAVWISLSAKGYGLHGTPEPDKVRKAASHGCVRLTNWDALDLARQVQKGTPVIITDAKQGRTRG